MALFVCSFTLTGCGSGGGSDDYDTPSSTDTAPIDGAATDVLVDADQVASWIKNGQIAPSVSASSFDRKVVILDFDGYTMDPAEDPERIKNSCRVTTTMLTKTRFEGVGDAAPMVATGEQMDAVIQRLGIDEDTTIVFTAGGTYFQTRAYWTFRYWGFDTDQLKVLNGGNAVFAAEYPELMTTEVPVPEPSTFSVRDLDVLNDDLRASVGEMIEIVKDLPASTENMVFDARGDVYYLGNKATSGKLGGDVVVVDGHPVGGEYLSWSSLVEDGKFKSAEEIRALFEAKASFSENKKATVYCTSAYSATPLFFALEAILGVDVQLYDGSWSQFGKYSDFAEAGGELPQNSPWAIDKYLDPNTYSYNDNIPSPLTIETLDIASAVNRQKFPFTGDVAGDSDVVQSQVEAADQAYAAGGGGVSFAAPVATATDDVLIDRATLEAWMDAGYVNAESGEKVVILDVTEAGPYASGHIPGAQLWDRFKHVQKRTEGPAPAINMVLEGSKMDAMIQAAGIDENTTIVITSSKTATYFPSRAYFLFRYWGFPKERIKVLNGYNGAWPAQDLVSTPTDLADTSLSVADFDSGVQLDTRVSLSELMDAARDGRGTAIDFRGDASGTGSTSGVYGESGDYVVFEGRLNNGKYYSFANFNVDYANGNLRYKSAAEITSEMTAAGIDVSTFSDGGSYTNPVYSYCRTAYIASTGFFVLDAILDIDVMTYDGSWSQWGKMSEDEDMGGELASGDVDYSAWATDTSEYMSIINYNVDNLKTVESLNPDADALNLQPGDTAANQVEGEDFEYQIQAGSNDTTEAPSAPAPGGGGSIGC